MHGDSRISTIRTGFHIQSESLPLFLEKQLTDVKTFVSQLPVLDVAEDWKTDANSGLMRTDPTKTSRSKKIAKPIVLYPATEQHPAQVQMYAEDILAGYWSTTKFSGAVAKPEKEELFERVEKLLVAIKEAREEANMADEVAVDDIGEAIFSYLLPSEVEA